MGCAHSSVGVDVHDVYLDNNGRTRGDPADKADDRTERAKPFAEGSMCEYKFLGKLGEGNYATVHKAQCPKLANGGIVAVKIMDLSVEGAEEREAKRLCKRRLSKVKHEVAILTQVAGMANVIGFYGSFVEESLSFFVMELCDRSLLQAIERLPAITEKTVSRILRDMFNGLSSVHQAGVVHRDVKPDNFMCVGRKATVKLCDFGLASAMPRLGKGLTGAYGTPPFMSPEMLHGCSYNEKTDAWSMGVIVYSLFYGRYPYEPNVKTEEDMKASIRSGSPAPSFRPTEAIPSAQKVSLGAREFSMALLERDQDLRISSTSALFHSFTVTPGNTNLAPTLEAAKIRGAFHGSVCRAQPRKSEVDLRVEAMQQQSESVERTNRRETLGIEIHDPATKGDDDDGCSTHVGSMIDSPVSSMHSLDSGASLVLSASP